MLESITVSPAFATTSENIPPVPVSPPAGAQCDTTIFAQHAVAVQESQSAESACLLAIGHQESAPMPVQWQTGNWQVLGEATVGLAHVRKNLPCQDAVRVQATPRLCLVAADGAGSALVSELGAQAVVSGMARLVTSFDRQIGRLLDHPDSNRNEANEWALLLVKHARGLLEDVAALHRRSLRDVRCTLLMIIAGAESGLWLKVGDGSLLIAHRASAEAETHCQTLGDLGKGEYANETVFLDAIKPDEVQWDFISMHGVCGAAIMSDGAAERLVSQDGTRVSARMTTLLESLRKEQLQRSDLTKMFFAPDFCERSSGDDRSLAMAARVLSQRTVQEPKSEQGKEPETSPERQPGQSTEPAQGIEAKLGDARLTTPAATAVASAESAQPTSSTGSKTRKRRKQRS
ncbi:MAG: PP2C family serine/threonine-protein phosphatase [Halothiobacillus sp.]|jgi:hypothetical protein|nr:PP2C family serine/threonine-protein phosphatase [Halothiobacillus sp.]